MGLFQKATKQKAKLKVGLTGPSGSGKTYSALRMAQGIGKKIAVVDTENGSASLYADRFGFDTANMTPPYLTAKYLKAIDEAVAAGYDVVILDSISHAWAAEGGILRRKDALDAGGKGNSYTNWNKFTPEHEQFIAKILHAPIHVIATMRSKQAYTLVDERGKQVPKKVGMAPVQRDGVEYEFTVVFDMGMNHQAEASKDRTGMFDGHVFQPSEELGKQLLDWVNDGSKPKVQETKPDPEPKPKAKAKVKPKSKKTKESPPVPEVVKPGSEEPPGEFHSQGNGALTEMPKANATSAKRHPADFQFKFGERRDKWASSQTREQLTVLFAKLKQQADKDKLNEKGHGDLLKLDRYLTETEESQQVMDAVN